MDSADVDTPKMPDYHWPCTAECKDIFDEKTQVQNRRTLPDKEKAEAIAYIESILKSYPYQLRPVLAMPMWHRFLDVYMDTGKRHLAMRAI